jgi:hypothetical protein
MPVKMYHLVWPYLLSLPIMFGGIILCVIHTVLDVPLYVGMGAFAFGLFLKYFVITWVHLKGGINMDRPNSPEGVPVEPSGIWADEETPLGIGSRVLVFSAGKWYRGIVLRVKSHDWFIIRLVGWDPFWDALRRRTELQIDTLSTTRDERQPSATDTFRAEERSTLATTSVQADKRTI